MLPKRRGCDTKVFELLTLMKITFDTLYTKGVDEAPPRWYTSLERIWVKLNGYKWSQADEKKYPGMHWICEPVKAILAEFDRWLEDEPGLDIADF